MTMSENYKLEQVGIRMVKEPPLYSTEPMNTPEAAVRVMAEALKQFDREVLCVVNLRSDLKPINMNVVSMGTLDQSLAHPREILKSIVLSNAGSVMLMHNHPSGQLQPSKEDVALTDRMQKICTLLGVPILDHIIIGNSDQYYSFKEHGTIRIPRISYAKSEHSINLGNQTVEEPSSKGTKYQGKTDHAAQMSIQEITEKLEKGVQDMFDSKSYKAYLSSMAKFHTYSLNNTILIAMQKPDATLVAGYQAWKQKHGRQVMKGEKGIRIIAPSPYKVKLEQDVVDPKTHMRMLDSSGNPVKQTVVVERPAFRVATVFDVTQTEGRELPSITVNELKGDVKDYESFIKVLKDISPVPISFENVTFDARGYYSVKDRRIVIQEGMSQIQTVKTAIHEMAHAMLHSAEKQKESKTDKSQRTKEVEAESIAYTICQHFGIDTSDYSFGYIAGWSSGKETEELRSSLETIRSTASNMIENIDDHLLQMEQVKEMEKDSVLGKLSEIKENAALTVSVQKVLEEPSMDKER